jgi:hypothetical protein
MLMLALVTAAFARFPAPLPDGVPDLFDDTEEWQPYQVGNVAGDSDFPLLMFLHDKGADKGAAQPAAVLLAVDAQNGSDHWSLASDPVIVIALLADPETITRIYYDAGFAQQGQPSGEYKTADAADRETLRALLMSLTKARHLTNL